MTNNVVIKRDKFAILWIFALCACLWSGCGTTKWSDTSRTGTEQLLISNAIDTAVNRIDFSPMGDKRVYLDTTAIEGVTDFRYLAKALRQHLAAGGGVICDEKEDSDYIVEARAGAVGTDRDELLLIGVPAMTLPSLSGTDISSATIPEIPVVKRTKQRGVAKVAVFAYNRHTGRPVWASGNNQTESTANNLWIAGAGPLSRGTIYKETTFAGHRVPEYVEANDRKTRTFADRTEIFQERADEPSLKEPRPGSEKLKKETEVATAPKAPPPLPATTGPYDPFLPVAPANRNAPYAGEVKEIPVYPGPSNTGQVPGPASK